MCLEIRTPLACILGTTNLLSYTELDKEQKDLVVTLKICSNHLINLVENVLEMVRSTHPSVSKPMGDDVVKARVRDTIDLESLGDSLVELFGQEAINKEVDLVIWLVPNSQSKRTNNSFEESDPPKQHTIQANAQWLRQIFTNLIGNAIKFTQSLIEVSAEIVRERVYSVSDSDSSSGEEGPRKEGTEEFIKFSVRDDGPGIPVESLPSADYIFGSFIQLHHGSYFHRKSDAQNEKSVKEYRCQGGAGLGLTICRRLVYLMGGRIWYENCQARTGKEPKGTTFHFTLLNNHKPIPNDFVMSKPLWQSLGDIDKCLGISGSHLVLYCSLEQYDLFKKVLSGGLFGVKVLVRLLSQFDRQNSPRDDAKEIGIVLADNLEVEEMSVIAKKHMPIIHYSFHPESISKDKEDGKDVDLCTLRSVICLKKLYKWLELTRAIHELLVNSLMRKQNSNTPVLDQHRSAYRTAKKAAQVVPTKPSFAFDCKGLLPEGTPIVLAEDDDCNAILVKKMLIRCGCEKIERFADGQATLDYLKRLMEDGPRNVFVFMDLQMPRMNGIEVTQAIRSKQSEHIKYSRVKIHILALTADAWGERREAGELAGLCGFLKKPLTFDDLNGCLQGMRHCLKCNNF